jgi:hypothetical protein
VKSVCNEGQYQGAVGDCVVVPDEGAPCDDGLFCTIDDTCNDAGTCVGGPENDCGMMPEACQLVTCDEAAQSCTTTPEPVGAPCDPGDLCIQGATCNSVGQCEGTLNDCFFVPTPNDCHIAVCNPMNGMCEPQPGNEGLSCVNPNVGCPVCSMGQCVDGLTNQTIYFEETFENNTAGWTFGTEWEIGNAQMSTGHTSSCGNGDPAMDHTPTNDDGVAGVVIGGNASTGLHAFYYLTSPPINLSTVNGTVWLGFHRWLNSDYTPFMQNVVEVWNGTAWVSLWATGGSPGITDSSWTAQAFDVTAHKHAAFQVRFGFNIGSSGVYTCSQWNVDDVILANVVCPQ